MKTCEPVTKVLVLSLVFHLWEHILFLPSRSYRGQMSNDHIVLQWQWLMDWNCRFLQVTVYKVSTESSGWLYQNRLLVKGTHFTWKHVHLWKPSPSWAVWCSVLLWSYTGGYWWRPSGSWKLDPSMTKTPEGPLFLSWCFGLISSDFEVNFWP